MFAMVGNGVAPVSKTEKTESCSKAHHPLSRLASMAVELGLCLRLLSYSMLLGVM